MTPFDASIAYTNSLILEGYHQKKLIRLYSSWVLCCLMTPGLHKNIQLSVVDASVA